LFLSLEMNSAVFICLFALVAFVLAAPEPGTNVNGPIAINSFVADYANLSYPKVGDWFSLKYFKFNDPSGLYDLSDAQNVVWTQFYLHAFDGYLGFKEISVMTDDDPSNTIDESVYFPRYLVFQTQTELAASQSATAFMAAHYNGILTTQQEYQGTLVSDWFSPSVDAWSLAGAFHHTQLRSYASPAAAQTGMNSAINWIKNNLQGQQGFWGYYLFEVSDVSNVNGGAQFGTQAGLTNQAFIVIYVTLDKESQHNLPIYGADSGTNVFNQRGYFKFDNVALAATPGVKQNGEIFTEQDVGQCQQGAGNLHASTVINVNFPEDENDNEL